jgi:hypothetical protein
MVALAYQTPLKEVGEAEEKESACAQGFAELDRGARHRCHQFLASVREGAEGGEVTLNEKLKELEAPLLDGSDSSDADFYIRAEKYWDSLLATLRLAVEQRNDWAERYWNERMRPELTERTLSEDDAALLRKLEGEK